MKLVNALILGGAGLAAAFLVFQRLPSVGSLASDAAQAVSDLGVRLWEGPPNAAATYAESVKEATTNPSAIFPTYSVSPYDLIPAGYTMNQYGDLVKNPQKGVTGYW